MQQSKAHDLQALEIEQEDSRAAEQALERDLKRILRPDSIVIDIGANAGQFAASLLGFMSAATVYSFEPVSEAFEELERLAHDKKNIHAFNLAIASKDGEVSFHVTESNVGSSLLEPTPGQPSKWLTPAKTITVPCKRLETFISENKLGQISLLKCDTQGADLEVLQSAGGYLQPDLIESVLVEINFHTFYKGQSSFGDISNFLERSGYRLASIYPFRAHDKWLWWADALFIGKRC